MKIRNSTTVTALKVIQLVLVRECSAWLLFPDWWWTACYDDPPIGCFPTSYPYNNTAGISPQHPDSINVQFYFYDNDLSRQLFNIHEADEVLDTKYNSSTKTVLIIHGYFENGFSSWIRHLGEELLKKDRHMNVIVVNWDGGSTNLIYYQSVANGRITGAVAALLLQKLIARGGDLSNFHVIGFSLGAHVAGHVGARLVGIGRITGLDPARPGFDGVPPESRLDPTDAIIVDVLHTDSDPDVGMGTLEPFGTIDFYPNGGINQPGCPVSMMDRMSALMSTFDFTSDSLRMAVGCSHIRVTQLFIASINNNCSYVTRQCNSASDLLEDTCIPCDELRCPTMGFHLESIDGSLLNGLYYTVTSSNLPYC